MLRKKKIALIGLGKLGETLVRGLLESKTVHPENITATAKHQATLENKKTLDVCTTLDNRAAVEDADVIVLAIKPQQMAEGWPKSTRRPRPVNWWFRSPPA